MFGFRLFWTLSIALCVCVMNWERAHAADPAPSDPRLLTAANVKPEKTKAPGKSAASKGRPTAIGKPKKTPKTSAAARDKKSADAAKTPHQENRAAWVRHRKYGWIPPASPDLPQSGVASWVGRYFHGRPVAVPNEVHVMESLTAAHRAIPFHSILKVTDMNGGRSVLVRVNDRGPYVRGRIIDLAKGAAEYLGYMDKGLTTVLLELAGNDKDPALRYYIRMRTADGLRESAWPRGFGPFDSFDEAASLFLSLYKSYPRAELIAVREQGGNS